ncbi:4614_t:CDS:2 [Funneliformis caledonium]|uniref:4614_t:CDS:1 n=1 Tax=Funneliformis caledonium TaxID=1117310 RepID=A0A9N9DPV5_9GLOM|nr:4614_t:CDS:2 [Funneliformis caledonium]
MTFHGMSATILHVYNYHQHLRLSPDDIWLTIAQGSYRSFGYGCIPFTTDTGLYLKLIAEFLGAQQELLENSNEVNVSPVIKLRRKMFTKFNKVCYYLIS